ncbi:hypothetical protein [Bacillus sp. Marseille-Q3570]|uniref:hypothetical protein n=1 Tax=Bacillus sp. Marseille-Q3570 TaxID=2963522 RepID=UPI0021B7A4AA|nr:hypothetical protein [Bacillus sp. Marseille-Q3570]
MENQILQAIKELQDQMNEGFNGLNTRIDKLENRMGRLEEGQQDIHEQLELLVEEHWQNKTDIRKLKKTIRLAQD